MSTKEVPVDWAELMVARGFTRSDGSANITALARKAGVAVESVRRLVHSVGTPRPDTIAAIGEQLGPRNVAALLNTRTPMAEWVPPAESVYLTPTARKALDVLVRELGRASRGDDHGTPTSQGVTDREKSATVTRIQPKSAPKDAAARRTGRKGKAQQRREAQDRGAED